MVRVEHLPSSTLVTSSTTSSVPLSDATSTNTPDWACIRLKESNDNYRASGDEPDGGAYQASETAWLSMGFSGVPNEAPPAVQNAFALKLYAWALKYEGNGFAPWQTAPLCGL